MVDDTLTELERRTIDDSYERDKILHTYHNVIVSYLLINDLGQTEEKKTKLEHCLDGCAERFDIALRKYLEKHGLGLARAEIIPFLTFREFLGPQLNQFRFWLRGSRFENIQALILQDD